MSVSSDSPNSPSRNSVNEADPVLGLETLLLLLLLQWLAQLKVLASILALACVCVCVPPVLAWGLASFLPHLSCFVCMCVCEWCLFASMSGFD